MGKKLSFIKSSPNLSNYNPVIEGSKRIDSDWLLDIGDIYGVKRELEKNVEVSC